MAMQDWKSVYSRIFWKNKREGGTPLNEANLNTSDIALKEIDNRILELRDAKFNSEDANGLVKDWNIDVATGIITVTWQNNTTEIYDLNIEKIPVNFEMSQDGIITMTTEDGSEYTADIKSVIPIYSFVGSATINVVSSEGENGEKVFTFSVVDGSIDGTKLNPDYLAEINTSVNNAQSSEQKSLEYSLLSKEYAEQSKASAESIGVASLEHTGTVRPDGTTITIDENGVISVISSGGVTAESTSFDNSETVIVKSDNVQGAIVDLDTAVDENKTLIDTIVADLTASDNTKFRFATDGEGNYGFLKADDSFVPFKKGGNVTIDGVPFEGDVLNLVSETTIENISVSTLPYNFYQGSAVVLNNEIHILGSNKDTSYTKHYKWSGSAWTEVSTLPYNFYQGSAVVYNKEIHILGSANSNCYNKHYKWNGITWTEVSTLPYDFCYGSAVVYNNEIHILGSSISSLQRAHYKWNGITWTKVSTLPYGFSQSSAVVYNKEIHILGSANSNYQTKHYKWNGSAWLEVSTLPYGFLWGSAVVFNNEIHIVGRHNSLNGHYKWNGSAWLEVAILPYVFLHGRTVIFKGEIHIMGNSDTTSYMYRHYSIEKVHYYET